MTPKEKVTKVVCWIGLLWFVGLGIYWLCTSPEPRRLWLRASWKSSVPTTTVDPTKTKWTMTCDPSRGTEIGRPGFIYPDSDVWITAYSERSISFSRYFSTDRKKEVGIFFWDKVNHMEEGSWSQEYPYDHGKWQMEGDPDKGFKGWLKNKEGLRLNFTLTPKK